MPLKCQDYRNWGIIATSVTSSWQQDSEGNEDWQKIESLYSWWGQWLSSSSGSSPMQYKSSYSYMSPLMKKPTKWHVRPPKTQISLGVFTVCMKKAWVLSYPLNAQRRLIDWADAQADHSLHWAHMPLCWFCHEAAHIPSWWSLKRLAHPLFKEWLWKQMFVQGWIQRSSGFAWSSLEARKISFAQELWWRCRLMKSIFAKNCLKRTTLFGLSCI